MGSRHGAQAGCSTVRLPNPCFGDCRYRDKPGCLQIGRFLLLDLPVFICVTRPEGTLDKLVYSPWQPVWPVRGVTGGNRVTQLVTRDFASLFFLPHQLGPVLDQVGQTSGNSPFDHFLHKVLQVSILQISSTGCRAAETQWPSWSYL